MHSSHAYDYFFHPWYLYHNFYYYIINGWWKEVRWGKMGRRERCKGMKWR